MATLVGNKFKNDEELKEIVTVYLNRLAAEDFDNEIQKLVIRYNKCLILNDNYVEN